MSRKTLIPLVILVILFAACHSKPKPEPRRYDFDGKIVSVNTGPKTLTISHKDIPGLMKGMTMDFAVKNQNVFSYAKPGDHISAVLVMDPEGEYLDDIAITETSSASDTSSVHLPQVGDQVPEFIYTKDRKSVV